ncbi:uncharacterized protein LOC123296605 [Chrysoperla carnea]|uniref:uncharacterized protein LOC123296605 n=1 Tax=Chrysoperla carnea TaxID=189513 RepID=UPI001D05CF8D|nr:uncharacterized protein LOC123296605 [Chrysoperla carnea]XP_044734080.1 uncharacterized protein LOC123296605 [Chrysoperla carnea]
MFFRLLERPNTKDEITQVEENDIRMNLCYNLIVGPVEPMMIDSQDAIRRHRQYSESLYEMTLGPTIDNSYATMVDLIYIIFTNIYYRLWKGYFQESRKNSSQVNKANCYSQTQ